ncbi:MAG: SDR family oxidoreductase [Lewinellaceae bacterium]|nr:SDR family oxidoreductase [Lewinellaceae bacterium]
MAENDKSLPFSGKVVWITGASAGIGEQLSYQFSELGASLILSARREEYLQKVNQNLPRNPGQAIILPLDLEQWNQLPEKVETALSCFGGVDILINNAAVGIRDYALATRLEVDEKLMNINYFGPVVLTKCLLPSMLEKGQGQVVVVSSLSGKYGVPRTAAYTAAKHALHGFFESLRSEITIPGICFTMIIAGIIQTNITAHALTGKGESFGRNEQTYQRGYPVEKAATGIIKAIQKKKEEVFVGGWERTTLWVHWLSPWVFRRVIRNHPIKWLRKTRELFSLSKSTSF